MNESGAITPIPIPDDVRGVVLFGGSFDPPHRAHVALAMHARDQLFGADGWLVYIPAARSPHKSRGPVASDEQRVAMLRLALEGVSRAAIWTYELDAARDGVPSYTIKTVRAARSALEAAVDLMLLIGADQAVSFDRWKDAREILELARVSVMVRPPLESGDAVIDAMRARDFWTPRELDAWREGVIEMASDDANSTGIREGDHASLDARVRAYIKEHGLYE